MNYGIKLQSCNRYVMWCDKKWFETDRGACHPFASIREAVDAIKQLVQHYVYHVTLVAENGVSIDFDFGKKRLTPDCPVQTIPTFNQVAKGDFSLF